MLNNDARSAKFFVNEDIERGDCFDYRVIGELEPAPWESQVSVNNDRWMSMVDMSLLIKRHPELFVNLEQHAELVIVLRNFDATITNRVESKDDFKGNKTASYKQELSNMPIQQFSINVPLFKGMSKEPYDIELMVDYKGAEIVCSLVSPQIIVANEALVNNALNEIEEAFQKEGITVYRQ